MTHYIGIDPSWTGFAIVRLCGAGSVLGRRTIETEKKDFRSRTARLIYIRDALQSVLLPCLPGPESALEHVIAAVEGYSMGSSHGREIAGELGGMVRVVLWEAGIPFLDVPPTTLKQFTTGKGVAAKEIMLREVYRRWGYDADDNNDCDAYALARFAMSSNCATPTAAQAKLVSKATYNHPSFDAMPT